MLDITAGLDQLPNVSEIQGLPRMSERTLMDSIFKEQKNSLLPPNLESSHNPHSYSRNSVIKTVTVLGDYLYEPNVANMKTQVLQNWLTSLMF
jgi:hypothetical protein